MHTRDIFALKLLYTGYTLGVVNASNAYRRGLSYFFWNAFVITYDGPCSFISVHSAVKFMLELHSCQGGTNQLDLKTFATAIRKLHEDTILERF